MPIGAAWPSALLPSNCAFRCDLLLVRPGKGLRLTFIEVKYRLVTWAGEEARC